MSKNIGPTFTAELEAAGVIGLSFSWGEDGSFQFGEEMTPTQIEAVSAVYDDHDPSKTLPR